MTVIAPRETEGPRLLTSKVYVALRPATIDPVRRLTICRSADVVTVTSSEEVLLL